MARHPPPVRPFTPAQLALIRETAREAAVEAVKETVPEAARSVSREVVRETVAQTLESLGVVAETGEERSETRADLAFLRKQRKGAEQVRTIVRRTAIGTFVVALIWGVVHALPALLKGIGTYFGKESGP